MSSESQIVLDNNYNPNLTIPDNKVHGTNMGPTWVLSAPGGPHVGPMNLAIWDGMPNMNGGLPIF